MTLIYFFVFALSSLVRSEQPQQPLATLSVVNQVCDLIPKVAQVVFPDDEDFRRQQASYYAAQQIDLVPSCRVVPRCPHEIGAVLQILAAHNTSFAVRSGGHSSYASNIGPGGVTIDLENLQSIHLQNTSGGITVRIGAGWRAGPLYKTLQEYGLSLVGPRNPTVGIGYYLGGGLSFYGNRFGFASSRIVSLQAVIANGTVLNVTESDHPDLFWSLRGAGLPAIVTAIELSTISDRPIQIESFIYSPTYLEALYTALDNSISANHSSSNTSLMFASKFSFSPTSPPSLLVAASFAITEPKSASPVPESFRQVPALTHGKETAPLSEFIEYFAEPMGERQWRATLTVRPNSDAFLKIHQLADQAIGELTDRCKASGWSAISLQPISDSYLDSDLFGLHESDGPLIIMFFQVAWNEIEHDSCVSDIATEAFSAMQAFLHDRHLLHPFVYSNYHGAFQDVFSSYGSSSKTRLIEIQRAYDPTAVFERLMQGRPKLDL